MCRLCEKGHTVHGLTDLQGDRSMDAIGLLAVHISLLSFSLMVNFGHLLASPTVNVGQWSVNLTVNTSPRTVLLPVYSPVNSGQPPVHVGLPISHFWNRNRLDLRARWNVGHQGGHLLVHVSHQMVNTGPQMVNIRISLIWSIWLRQMSRMLVKDVC